MPGRKSRKEKKSLSAKKQKLKYRVEEYPNAKGVKTRERKESSFFPLFCVSILESLERDQERERERERERGRV